ncbi:hypothetical protein GCM10010912_02140 [Paenibacillus albidus]|uniref:Uncharacterized protein n=1 Tax=Paenibacillus albidus TaxID=2041023 RepID=A0A917FAI4_9BACL|nr:hypothetical protein [Paenibacillus albidus]MBT2291935.1 hypothetical protein [Paenibacillus albidus]GGF60505.1 hypothetical protein GCM10010912_02140 [Paenibacillus albidus]
MAEFFEVLYWVAMVGMSVVLAGVTILVCAIGFKFIKDRRRLLGAGCIAFSLGAAAMVVFMINYKFIIPA